MIETLLVYPEAMARNLDQLGGLIHSQRVLLALTQAGASREAAYRIVQDKAMAVWAGEGDFLALLKDDPKVTAKLSAEALEACCDMADHLKHVETIFARVFR